MEKKAVTLSILIVSFLAINSSQGALPAEGGIFMMPMNCSELLPDDSPFINFFEAVARGTATQDKRFSKRLFRILALREKLAEINDWIREQNPVDNLIRKMLCYYREQKEPLKPIPFDNEGFVKFLKDSIKELEGKVDNSVFQIEYERFQRKEYEIKLQKNRGAIEEIRREADSEARHTYENLSAAAQRKVRIH